MEVIFFLIVLVIVIALICAAIAFALPFILMALIMVLFVAFLYGIGKSLIGYYSALITTYGKKVGITIGVTLTLFWLFCCLFVGRKFIVPLLASIGVLQGII
ncbi:hypothetical protein [Bifidobacterium sp. ESL0820]|uniref:hypothetical protein n=1 Tax=Bifidobacterium sp. ESL0820 TaxID=3448586 RepID=UPI004041867C